MPSAGRADGEKKLFEGILGRKGRFLCLPVRF